MKPIARDNFITHTEKHPLSHVVHSFFEEVVVDAYTKKLQQQLHTTSPVEEGVRGCSPSSSKITHRHSRVQSW